MENVEIKYVDELVNPAREDGHLATGVICKMYYYDSGLYAWLPQGAISGTGGGSDPLIAYKITDSDDSTATKYYGYLNASGDWYILKIDGDAYRYAKGSGSYAAAWADKEGQDYGYFNDKF